MTRLRWFAKCAVVLLLIAAIPLIVLGYNAYAVFSWLEIQKLEKNGVAVGALLVEKEASELPRNSTYRLTLRHETKTSGGRTQTFTSEHVADE